MSAVSSITLSDCRRLAYTLAKPTSDARIVLLSNSLCAPLRSWDKVASCLNRDGFGVLRYDQPGHGASDAPTDFLTTSFESLASDVKELLDTLKIDCLYAWIGVSMGAATGVYFATAFPGVVEKLIICDTITCSAAVAGVQDVFAPRVEAARNAGNLDAIVEQTIERWFSSAWRSANYSEVQRMRSIMKDTRVDGFTACCNALQSESFDLRPLVARLGDSVKGVLFGVGELDANLPQTMEMLRAETQKSFDRAGSEAEIQLRKIKGAGHVCYIDGLDGFYDMVIEFLSQMPWNRAKLS